MTSVFPQLLTFGLVTPLLFRLVLAVAGFLSAKEHYNNKRPWLSILFVLTSIFLGIGLFTQVVALIGILLIKIDWHFQSKTKSISQSEKTTYVLLGVILFSLLFSGPGFIAIDYPL